MEEPELCVFPGCDRAQRARKFCDTHYRTEKRRLKRLEQSQNELPILTPEDVTRQWRKRLGPKR